MRMIAVGGIETRSLGDSNMFLRALWARMRTRFGPLRWQYTPKRDGPRQSIRFGWATLGASAPTGVEVSVHYSRRGIIDSVQFTPRGAIYDLYPDLDGVLRDCAREATVAMHSPASSRLAARLASAPCGPVSLYFSERWYIGPLDDGSTEIGLTVEAFDEADSRYEFQDRMGLLLDALTAWTNCTFRQADYDGGNSDKLKLPDGIFWEDQEWLDGHPIADDLIRLERSQLALGDEILRRAINSDHNLMRACHLFHEGVNLHHYAPDMATALFVSALEVISLTDEPTPPCQTCGQPMYKISKRVTELGVRHLGPGVKWVFDSHYKRRSGYLHRGERRATQPMLGHSIPLLDPNGIEGCAMPRPIGQPTNLMEFTSFVIRGEMRAYMSARSACAVT